ncbi:MAG: FMN-binding negative transcriptional regulator [Bryobacteraceae bacterium]|nr:FMN-binding negative transcriptional regulator [Bryobacteraceae bacterium]
MYVPAAFREERPELLHRLIREYSLATLVTHGEGGLTANHLPMLLDAGAGTLRGHMARANPHRREIGSGAAALAIFHGPQHYISPSWYVSKRAHGKVVPTWNYATVHVHGTLRVFEDRGELLHNVRELTAAREAGMPEPWTVDDAPAEFIEGLLAGIVGVELAIGRMEGKWKVSQNRPPADRASVAIALRGLADSGAARMADLVEAVRGE